MPSNYVSFYITKSLELKLNDLVYKFNFVPIKNFNKNKAPTIDNFIPRVRLLGGFLDNKYFKSLAYVRTLGGFFAQYSAFNQSFELSKFRASKFGFKNAYETYWFLEIKGNTDMLQFFWVYCPIDFIQKLTSVGLIGSRFPYLRFLILNIFNFFGAQFFQSFYLNYFDFPGIFSVDITPNFHKKLASCGNAYTEYRLSVLQNWFSFFKLI